eukprot:comp19136_c0_seq1/m.21788 comp19136_c0_seq1/g.21788  ORF comp19136_c0_seq1/g.21788 comp19136_c0_seq1/m.21788 type:complete len:437 (-) comp19136_c0_seq1:101-1411(-)
MDCPNTYEVPEPTSKQLDDDFKLFTSLESSHPFGETESETNYDQKTPHFEPSATVLDPLPCIIIDTADHTGTTTETSIPDFNFSDFELGFPADFELTPLFPPENVLITSNTAPVEEKASDQLAATDIILDFFNSSLELDINVYPESYVPDDPFLFGGLNFSQREFPFDPLAAQTAAFHPVLPPTSSAPSPTTCSEKSLPLLPFSIWPTSTCTEKSSGGLVCHDAGPEKWTDLMMHSEQPPSITTYDLNPNTSNTQSLSLFDLNSRSGCLKNLAESRLPPPCTTAHDMDSNMFHKRPYETFEFDFSSDRKQTCAEKTLPMCATTSDIDFGASAHPKQDVTESKPLQSRQKLKSVLALERSLRMCLWPECTVSGAEETHWRMGPHGPGTLCNRHGLKHLSDLRKDELNARRREKYAARKKRRREMGRVKIEVQDSVCG